MKKLYTHIEYSRVGHLQSFLEESGIRTLVKNKAASTGMGEIPFIEIWPELWVVNDEDFETAETLLENLNKELDSKIEAWTCPKCQKPVDEGFSECWNCGEVKKT